MRQPVLHVESLSKSYVIHHQRNERYVSLREVISDKARNVVQRLSGGDSKKDSTRETFWALRDVSFDVRPGERIGVIGRNGAGKSTLLKLLSRITDPTTGRISIRGRVSSLLEVGTGFHPELTGRENIYLNGAILGMQKTEIERKFEEIVEFSEVGKFLDTPVKRYSSGMYVRLAFAVAAHLEPEILLVDEVLAVGDIRFQRKCLGKMEEVADGGRTVIFVSHNMASISSLCDRVILLEDGVVVSDGDPTSVLHQYLEAGESTKAEVHWADSEEAPADGNVRLLSVCVLGDGVEGPVGEVDASSEVTVRITYRNLRKGSQAYSGIVLHDKLGAPILQSMNSDGYSLAVHPYSATELPEGVFCSSCKIPSYFLNEGRYSLSIMMGQTEPFRQTIYEDRVIALDVVITDDPNKSYYAGCAIRPRLTWNTERT